MSDKYSLQIWGLPGGFDVPYNYYIDENGRLSLEKTGFCENEPEAKVEAIRRLRLFVDKLRFQLVHPPSACGNHETIGWLSIESS